MTVDEEDDALDDLRRQFAQSCVARDGIGGAGGSRATGKGFHAQQQPRRIVGEAQREAAVGRDLQVDGGALEVVRVRECQRGQREERGQRRAAPSDVPARSHRGYHTLPSAAG